MGEPKTPRFPSCFVPAVSLSAAGTYVAVVRNLAARIANRTDRPKWNNASFFRRFALAAGIR